MAKIHYRNRQPALFLFRFWKEFVSMKAFDITEAEIVEGCLKADRRYQKLLYERYYGAMMTVCMRYVSNREEARDILHEGFMKVFTHLTKFEKQTNLGAWIRRIMVNTAIDVYRKNAKQPESVEINTALHESDYSDAVSDMSADEILSLVQKLSPAYRTVFNLYVLDGYAHREIGEMLGISEGTSKSNLAKARVKLQKMILDRQKYHNNG